MQLLEKQLENFSYCEFIFHKRQQHIKVDLEARLSSTLSLALNLFFNFFLVIPRDKTEMCFCLF